MRVKFAILLILSAVQASGESPAQLVARLALLDLSEKAQMKRESVDFDDASRDRIEIEFALVAAGNKAVPDLVAALDSEKTHVRMIAARLLGIVGDAAAAAKLESIALHDGEASVRISAIQSLEWLKAAPKTLSALASDPDENVAFLAREARDQQKADSLGEVRNAYKQGIRREAMAAAKDGDAAPDFTLAEADGKPLHLGDLKGKRNVVLLFPLAEW